MRTGSYYQYWGKTDKSVNGELSSFHLLPYHCLDVAAVGYLLLDPEEARCQRLVFQLDVESKWLRDFFVFCLVLHDLGKFSKAFQGLQADLSEDLVKANQRMPYTERHDTLGYLLWQNSFVGNFAERTAEEHGWLRKISPWLKIVFGHHGIPPKQSGESLGKFFEPEDKVAAWEFIYDAMAFFLDEFDPAPLEDKKLTKKVTIQRIF